MKKTGILGGTFNPVHTGHLIIAENARREAGLDRVLFVPARTPPHKRDLPVTDANHRLEMLRLAIRGNSSFEVSAVELARPEVSYSVETVKLLKAEKPATEFYFIIGSDSLFELHLWREAERLVELCEFIVVGRPDHDIGRVTAKAVGLSKAALEKLMRHVIRLNPMGVSASEIRQRVAEGRSIRYLVPTTVQRYIEEHGLYVEGIRKSKSGSRKK